MKRMIVGVILGLTVLAAPVLAAATVLYTFVGFTAALPPHPGHPDGVPAQLQAFTATWPTFLVGSTWLPVDSCLQCVPGLPVFVQRGRDGDLSVQIDAPSHIGYAYFFEAEAWAIEGWHTTAEYDAAYGESLGPYENRGVLQVRVVGVPGAATGGLLLLGFGVAWWAARRP